MTCYGITVSSFTKSADILNQFNRHLKVTVRSADMLCVPTTLLHHTP